MSEIYFRNLINTYWMTKFPYDKKLILDCKKIFTTRFTFENNLILELQSMKPLTQQYKIMIENIAYLISFSGIYYIDKKFHLEITFKKII